MGNLLARSGARAVLIDYTGTLVMDDEPYTRQLVAYFITHSDLTDPAQALKVVWGLIKRTEDECYLDTFIMKDEMVDRILATCVREFGLSGDLDHMHDLWRNAWIHAPLYDDVRPFLDACPVPVYVVTNDDLRYVEESFEEKGLAPTGIVAAEMVRACKPHPELFAKALEVAGVRPDEAIMVGDSVTSDMLPARALGIQPILLDRAGTHQIDDPQLEGVTVIHGLAELLA